MAKLPFVFIGSSVEGLPAAKAIQSNLQHVCESQIWHQGLFGLSSGTLETLVNKLDSFDFAILCLTPDDLTISRGQEKKAPRDNVILELGLFMGKLGRERVYMVIDREADARMPSDLAGINPAQYRKPESGNWQSALGPACNDIESEISRLGSRAGDCDLNFIITFASIGDKKHIFVIMIENRGKELPPHAIRLKRGELAFYPFEDARAGEPLLRDQVRTYVLTICEIGVHDDISPALAAMIRKPDGSFLTDAELSEFSFDILIRDGFKSLFKSHELGAAIMKYVTHVITGRGEPPDAKAVFKRLCKGMIDPHA
jgi:hypothetical protein